jgi:hypothetical protein
MISKNGNKLARDFDYFQFIFDSHTGNEMEMSVGVVVTSKMCLVQIRY